MAAGKIDPATIIHLPVFPRIKNYTDRTFSNYDLGDGKYMVNWIEASGLVVSQIADFANGRVYAFMTWPDENARGKTAELLHKGTLKIMD